MSRKETTQNSHTIFQIFTKKFHQGISMTKQIEAPSIKEEELKIKSLLHDQFSHVSSFIDPILKTDY